MHYLFYLGYLFYSMFNDQPMNQFSTYFLNDRKKWLDNNKTLLKLSA